MAIDPLTLRLALQAIETMRKKEKRDAATVAVLTPVLFVLFSLVLVFYILTSPLSFFAGFLFDDDLTLIDDFQSDYGFSQSIGIYETDYVVGSAQNYDGITFSDSSTPVVYYNQLDSRWKDEPYGTDKIGTHGCGPTAMAMVISSLTTETIDPINMANWAYNNGGWADGQGSYHSFIPNCAEAWGLPVEGISKTDDMQKIVDALSSGQLVVAIMGPGEFTRGGHFIVLRGVTADGKILVADPASSTRSNKEYDLSLIIDESRNGASAGGPFWAIGQIITTDEDSTSATTPTTPSTGTTPAPL